MRVANQILLSLLGVGMFCIDLKGQDFELIEQSKNKIMLSDADIHYIYNRAFDIALRDANSTVDLVTIYYNTDYINHDTIILTVDPKLDDEAFEAFYIDEIDSLSFEYSLQIQDMFNEISIINTGAIRYYHWDTVPPLKDNHMIHFIFSDIYVHKNEMYLGVITYNQAKFFNYNLPPPHEVILNDVHRVFFKMEWCNDKFVLFRKYFVPIGTGQWGGKRYYAKEINDRNCY
jgi:hypothetical protein